MGTEAPELMTLETPSVGWTTFARVPDYARAWSSERGRCHRFVYDEHGKPDNCPEPNATSGWCRDGQGRWYVVDACARHASQLVQHVHHDMARSEIPFIRPLAPQAPAARGRYPDG